MALHLVLPSDWTNREREEAELVFGRLQKQYEELDGELIIEGTNWNDFQLDHFLARASRFNEAILVGYRVGPGNGWSIINDQGDLGIVQKSDKVLDHYYYGGVKWMSTNGEETVTPQLIPTFFKLNHTQEPCLFLDRDGILNFDAGYVSQFSAKIMNVEIVPLLKEAQSRGMKLIVLTNQSGVGRGYYNEEDVLRLHQKMSEWFLNKGIIVDHWIYSPFHPEAKLDSYRGNSLSRKPYPGMALRVSRLVSIDFRRSLMIGDKLSDNLYDWGVQAFLLKGNYDLSDVNVPVAEDCQQLHSLVSAYMEQKFSQ